MVERLDARLRGPQAAAKIDADEFSTLAAETGLKRDALLVACLPWAQRWARAPLSNFQVGAVALADSGVLYFGANIEFHGLPHAQTIHAEQSVIAHAWSRGETTLQALATSAAPCGFCRQFMLELAEPQPVLILAEQLAHGPVELDALLPMAFGPTQLGRTPTLLRAGPHALEFNPPDPDHADDSLATLALAAAKRSNAPYTGAFAGVALATRDGQRFAGAVAESAAYNPTLAPMQAALIALHHSGGAFDQIERAVLVELDDALISQLDAATAILASLAPNATLTRRLARL